MNTRVLQWFICITLVFTYLIWDIRVYICKGLSYDLHLRCVDTGFMHINLVPWHMQMCVAVYCSVLQCVAVLYIHPVPWHMHHRYLWMLYDNPLHMYTRVLQWFTCITLICIYLIWDCIVIRVYIGSGLSCNIHRRCVDVRFMYINVKWHMYHRCSNDVTWQSIAYVYACACVCVCVLQCVAVCCSVLQRAAACGSALDMCVCVSVCVWVIWIRVCVCVCVWVWVWVCVCVCACVYGVNI